MENVASGEAVGGFQILRRDHLHGFNHVGKIRRVGRKRSYYRVAELPAAVRPIPFLQFEWRELHVGGDNVLAFGREGRIEKRGNGYVEIRRGGKFAVLGGVESALQVIDFGSDVNAAGEGFDEAVGSDGVGERREIGETVKGEMNLGYGAVRTEIADAQRERRIE